MMLTYRLVRLIETHSDELAHKLMARVQASERTKDFLEAIPAEELEARAHEIYQNLGDWLLKKTEADVERRYIQIGSRRAHQRVPLHEVLWGIVQVKENLWEFLKREGMVDRPVELLSELEMLELCARFFDRAMYFAAVGYEQVVSEKGRPILLERRKTNRRNVAAGR